MNSQMSVSPLPKNTTTYVSPQPPQESNSLEGMGLTSTLLKETLMAKPCTEASAQARNTIPIERWEILIAAVAAEKMRRNKSC